MINTGLSVLGYWWVCLSILATSCVVVGFYIPHWIIGAINLNGRKNSVYFGSFRRCNYPIFDQTIKHFRMEFLCGRYSSFSDIPSIYWQIASISIGCGCVLAVVVVFMLIPSCCIKHIVSKNSSILFGLIQVVAAVGISSGCVIYPLGWDNPEIRDACGTYSGRYLLGECQLGWAYISMLTGSALLLVCGGLSICGGRELDPPRSRSTLRIRDGRYFSFDADTLIDTNLKHFTRSQSQPLVSNRKSSRSGSQQLVAAPSTRASKHRLRHGPAPFDV
uniref:Uncharacterized protein n=1 Tax=Acrobeloides nanus TaxID=290746 RepID=A0A914EF79_9BILA